MGRAMTQRAGSSSGGRSTSVRDPEAVDAAQEALSGLWNEYKLSGSPLARDKLILQYSPLVKYVAGRVSTGLPSNIENPVGNQVGLLDVGREPGRDASGDVLHQRRVLQDQLVPGQWRTGKLVLVPQPGECFLRGVDGLGVAHTRRPASDWCKWTTASDRPNGEPPLCSSAVFLPGALRGASVFLPGALRGASVF